MGKYDLWSIKCKLCDWQWETTSKGETKDAKCRQCGSRDLIIEKNSLKMIKKEGKFITEFGYAPLRDEFGGILNETEGKTIHFERPLLIIRENDCRFVDGMSNEERLALLGKMELIKTKILRDIRDNKNE